MTGGLNQPGDFNFGLRNFKARVLSKICGDEIWHKLGTILVQEL